MHADGNAEADTLKAGLGPLGESVIAREGLESLSRAERDVLRRARSSDARRPPGVEREEFARAAKSPALPFEPGAADAVTDAVRAKAVLVVETNRDASLVEVLERRRSATTRLTRFSCEELLALLAVAYRVVDAGQDPEGRVWNRRPVPSGGATHAFELLVRVEDISGLETGHYVFGASALSLRPLAQERLEFARGLDAASLMASRREAPAPATISLVANIERVAQHYDSVLVHLLRDAGVVLQTLHLVATGLGLRSGIVGTVGQLVNRAPGAHLVAEEPTVVNCGAIVLGGAGGQ